MSFGVWVNVHVIDASGADQAGATISYGDTAIPGVFTPGVCDPMGKFSYFQPFDDKAFDEWQMAANVPGKVGTVKYTPARGQVGLTIVVR